LTRNVYSSKLEEMKLEQMTREQLLDEIAALQKRLSAAEQLAAVSSEGKIWREMVENAPDLIVMVDHQGTILALNRDAPGFTRQEAIGANINDFTLPEHWGEMRAALRRACETGEPSTVETVAVYPPGGQVWYSMRVSPAHRDGELQTATLVATDISRQKRTEQDLARAQAMLLAAIEQTPAGILIADAPDVKIRIANTAALEVRGETDAPLTGIAVDRHSPHWQTCHPDGTPVPSEKLPLSRAVMQGETSHNEEYIIRRESGEERWVLANAAPVRGADGEVEAGIVVFSDITAVKRSQGRLQQRLEIERLVGRISASFLGLDPEQTEVEVQQALLELGRATGVDRCYLFQLQQGGTLVSNTHEWAAPGIEPQKDNLQQMPAETFPWWMEQLRQDHNIIVPRVAGLPPEAVAEREFLEAQEIQSLAVVPLRYGGELWGFLGLDSVRRPKSWGEEEVQLLRATGNIITAAVTAARAEDERRSLELQLIQSQKLDAIGRLAGGVAHDFNNLLTGIQGYAEMIEMSLRPGDPLLEDLGEIQSAAGRASDLTQQLLAFSRRQTIDPRPLDLGQVVRQSKKMLGRLIGEQIELLLQPGDDLWQVQADPHQLEQVLLHLALNARDAMPDGGRLVLETRNVSLGQDASLIHPECAPGDYVRLTVTDSGEGMDADTLEHIFEPFFTSREQGQGLGLGLSTVYGIVHQNGGWISVSSERGLGSTFNIFLPRLETAQPAVVAERRDASLGGQETILLVEDETMVLRLASKILGRHGYRVLEADSGSDALLLAHRHQGPIHLLLTDVVMPTMNGQQLYQQLLEILPDLRVLYTSGYSDNIIAHHGVLQEGTNFVAKPFTVASLLKKVRLALNG
jgi:PAS domain S-box-containing protein